MITTGQTVKVQEHGYIRIPAGVVSEIGIRENSRLRMATENGNIILSKYDEPKEILAKIDALEKALTENGSSIGTKRWRKCLRCITALKGLFLEDK